MSMEVAYYNELLAVWEPLLEPVEVGGQHRPWELGLEVSICSECQIKKKMMKIMQNVMYT